MWGGFIVGEFGDGKPNSDRDGESLDKRLWMHTMLRRRSSASGFGSLQSRVP